MAKIDDLFFELSVKRGPGSDAEISRFTQLLRTLGKSADALADEMQGAAKSTDQLDKEAKGATTTLGRLFQRLKGAGSSITAISTGFLAMRTAVLDVFRAVRGLVRGFANLVQRGGEVTNVARAFTRVVGDQEAALQTLRGATQGLIADFDLMVQFNRAIALGSAENVEQFAKLSETALTLGRALGVDAAFALESLNLGIGRQSRLILDNLGLIISVEQANRDYALALDKSVESLTDQEKRQAFVNAALTAADEKIEALGGTQLTAADNLTRLNVAFANFRDRLGQALTLSPVVAQGINLLIEAFEGLFDILENLIGLGEADVGEFVDLSSLEEIILFVKTIPAEFDVLAAKVAVVTATIRNFFSKAFGGIIDDQRDLIIRLGTNFIEFSQLFVNRINPAIQLAAAGVAEFLETIGEAAAANKGFADASEDNLILAREALVAAELALDSTRARAIAEVDLTRRIAERNAAEAAAAIDPQAALQALQALNAAFEAATVTAAEKGVEAVDIIRRQLVAAFGEIPEEARKQFETIERLAAEALSEERARELGERFAAGFTAGLEDIDFQALTGAVTDAEAQQLRLDFLEAQRVELEAQLAAIKAGTAAERALRQQLVQVLNAQKKITDETKKAAEIAEKEALKAAKDQLKAQQALVGQILLAVQGALDLANAFGIIDDELQKTVETVAQLGAGISSLISAIQAIQAGVGGIGGLLTGGLAILGGIASLIGGGPSPAQLELQRVLEENNKALNDLRAGVLDLKGSFDITGGDLATALRDLARGPVEEAVAELEPFIGGPLEEAARLAIAERLAMRLRALGVDMRNLDDVAEELGITIRDDAGNLIPEALLTLEDALQSLAGSLVGFADTIEGALARFRAELDIFDIEDPIEQFKLLQERLLDIAELDAEEIARIVSDPTLSFIERAEALGLAIRQANSNITPFLAQLLAIDVSTAEGRARADELIRSLFTQLAEGILSPEDLGAATFEEAIAILQNMENILDGIEEEEEGAGDDLEGQTQDIRRQVQITELQAAQLLAFQATQTELLRQIRDLLGGDLDIKTDTGGIRDLRELLDPSDLLMQQIELLREIRDLLAGGLPGDGGDLGDVLGEFLDGTSEVLMPQAEELGQIRDLLSAGLDVQPEVAADLSDVLNEFLAGSAEVMTPQADVLGQIRDLLSDGLSIKPEDGADLRDFLNGDRAERVQPPALDPEEILGRFITPPAPSEPMIGEVRIEAEIVVGAGATPEQAEEVKEIFLDDIATELGKRLLDAQRQVGLPPSRRERLE